MNEARRQSYLRAMGLTPWVAHTPLPGAAGSPWLDWDEEQDAPPATAVQPDTPSPVAQPRESAEVAEGQPATDPASALKERLQPPARPRAEPAPAGEASPKPAPAPTRSKGLVFTLEAHLGTGTWLLCAQEDTQAPGLGRFEAPLMASLLSLFQGRPGRPRRFFCPLTEQPMQADEAARALSAFIAGLCEQAGGEQVLLALPESLNQALFDQPRYQPFEIGGHRALVISGLGEMLEDPATHKKASWQAMQEHGFDGT